MKNKHSPSRFVLVMVILFLPGILGCTQATLQYTPTWTVTQTEIPTKTALPTSTSTSTSTSTPEPTATITKTSTSTPEPSPTSTLPPAPTSSVNDPASVAIEDECRRVIDGLYNLKGRLEIPEHLEHGSTMPEDSDFDPNSYFQVLTHLKMAPGYLLDYIYFGDELGGLPLVYARKSTVKPFQSYEEFLDSYGDEQSGERSYGSLKYSYEYLNKVEIDGDNESYFEFVALAFLGDQFYLRWHALYNDVKILCDSSDLERVDEDLTNFDLQFPADVTERNPQIDYRPLVLVEEAAVTVRIITFTKWGGFYENVYIMDREDPAQLIDVQFNTLIEYDCGINF